MARPRLPALNDADILLALLRGAPASVASGADWPRIAALAETEGAASLLHAALAAGPSDDVVPSAVRARLRVAYERTWARTTVLLSRYDDVAVPLARAGIRALALKGIALVETVYRDPGLRPMADIDVLVPAADFARAQEELQAAGWTAADGEDRGEHAFRGFAHLTRGGGVLDLHRDIAGYPRVAAVVRVDHAGLWRRAQPLARGGWRLAHEDQLLHLVHHLVLGSEFGRLLNFVDVDRLVRTMSLDWERVIAEARRWRIAGVLGYVLRVAVHALATPVPGVALDRLRPSSLQRLGGHLAGGTRPPTLGAPLGTTRVYVAETLLMDQARGALRVAATTLFPPAPWLRFHYHARSAWGVAAARAWHPVRVVALAARRR